jgi:hypothetical protein
MDTIHFRTADLPVEFCQLPGADQLLLIRAATELYTHMKEELFVSWAATEETVQSERWREEGRREVVTEKRALAAALAAAEATAEALRATVDRRVEERVADRIAIVRAECETDKMREMLVLRERIATAEGKDKYIESLEGNVSLLRDKHATLETRYADLNTQLLEVTTSNTKSSHAIGKIGEATVLDLLETTVLQEFPYSTVKDMTTVSHAADFHLWIMTPKGKRVKMLVDSKKYKRRINSDEINKLIADVDADDDAECGMMISLDSAICTMKQFQIKNTPKHKPILYLSFDGVSEEHRREVVCWGVHALLAVTKEIKHSTRDVIADNIDYFLSQINENVKDIDSAIRTQSRALDSLRQARTNIIASIQNFRKMAMLDGVEDDSDEEVTMGCSTILKATGTRCGKPVVTGSEKCRGHAPRKAGPKEDVIAHVE